jgi:hypothetical protein
MKDSDVRTNLRSRLRARLAPRVDDQGIALISVIILATIMTMISSVVIFDSTSELRRATVQVDKTSALQAAQSGIDDYLAKMTQDNLYYFHYVHAGEPVRNLSTVACTFTGPPATYAWGGLPTWTYCTNRRWVKIGTSGYEYSFKITAPTAAEAAVQIVSTGRKVGDPGLSNWRSIQTKVRGSSVADYQMVSDATVSYGDGATTNGRIYSKFNINFSGVVRTNANLLAEGSINGAHILGGTPQAIDYDSNSPSAYPNNIRSQLKAPVDFNTFLTALATVKSVAGSVGLPGPAPAPTFDIPGKVWKILFKTGAPKGKVDVSTCTPSTVQEDSSTTPTCVAYATNITIPDIAAMYFGQRVIVSGTVQGQVTLASAADILIGGNIFYNTTGQDILGLIAQTDIVVPQFAPDNLTWYAATVAMTGQWHNGNGSSGSGTMNFWGSTATKNGGSMAALFTTRNYNYDSTLAFLQPPFFPVISVNYQVLLFREITPVP